MYIDGQLKGGFQTVKDYAEFCGRFKSWLEEKSLKLWPPRHGDVLAQDYRDALDYVNKELSLVANEQELTMHDFLSKACNFIERLHEVWLWQNQHGTAYRKEHRSSILVRRHECFRKYLEKGHVEDCIQLRLYFERREILSHWLKDNLWLVSLIGDAAIQSLRPPLCSAEVTIPVLSGDPVACLVQRFLETGLQSDFNKIRMKLVEISNLQIHMLMDKVRNLQEAVCADSLRPDRHFYFGPAPKKLVVSALTKDNCWVIYTGQLPQEANVIAGLGQLSQFLYLLVLTGSGEEDMFNEFLLKPKEKQNWQVKEAPTAAILLRFSMHESWE
eukprot:gene3139-3607_t